LFSLACGGTQSGADTTEPHDDEAAAEPTEPAPAHEPPPRTTATSLAPAGAPRTLPSSTRPAPASSAASTEPFVEPVRPRRPQSPGEAAPEEDGPRFDAEIVSSRVRSVEPAITDCYLRELARDPSLQGTVNIEFRLIPEGSVVDVMVLENTVSPAVGACVASVIDALHFSPGPVGGSILYRYPFVFEQGRR
jgi:TonB family protein